MELNCNYHSVTCKNCIVKKLIIFKPILRSFSVKLMTTSCDWRNVYSESWKGHIKSPYDKLRNPKKTLTCLWAPESETWLGRFFGLSCTHNWQKIFSLRLFVTCFLGSDRGDIFAQSCSRHYVSSIQIQQNWAFHTLRQWLGILEEVWFLLHYGSSTTQEGHSEKGLKVLDASEIRSLLSKLQPMIRFASVWLPSYNFVEIIARSFTVVVPYRAIQLPEINCGKNSDFTRAAFSAALVTKANGSNNCRGLNLIWEIQFTYQICNFLFLGNSSELLQTSGSKLFSPLKFILTWKRLKLIYFSYIAMWQKPFMEIRFCPNFPVLDWDSIHFVVSWPIGAPFCKISLLDSFLKWLRLKSFETLMLSQVTVSRIRWNLKIYVSFFHRKVILFRIKHNVDDYLSDSLTPKSKNCSSFREVAS